MVCNSVSANKLQPPTPFNQVMALCLVSRGFSKNFDCICCCFCTIVCLPALLSRPYYVRLPAITHMHVKTCKIDRKTVLTCLSWWKGFFFPHQKYQYMPEQYENWNLFWQAHQMPTRSQSALPGADMASCHGLAFTNRKINTPVSVWLCSHCCYHDWSCDLPGVAEMPDDFDHLNCCHKSTLVNNEVKLMSRCLYCDIA